MIRTLLLSLILATAASSQIVVNAAHDNSSNDGECTLREAIVAANTDLISGTAVGECAAGSGDDVVHLAVPVGSTITVLADLPYISNGLTIEGPNGAHDGVTISGNDQYKLINFDSGGLGKTLVLRGLTITRGLSSYGGGVALSTADNCLFEDIAVVSNTSTSAGGGIATGGTGGLCTLDRVLVADNETQGFASGGGIRVGNSGSIVIRNSSITGNRSPASGGGGILVGCFSEPDGTFLIEQSTISSNVAAGGGGGFSAVGAHCTGTIRATTIVGNAVTDPSSAGGGVEVSWDVVFESTIIANNTAVRGAEWADLSLGNNRTTSLGGNVIGTNGFFTSEFPTGTPNANSDMVGQESAPLDAMLGDLAFNSAHWMPTNLPLAGSPVLDAGVCGAFVIDQRGGDREIEEPTVFNLNGDACDSGAVEGTTQAVDAALSPGTVALALSQPYPSPTRGASTVRFELRQAGSVRLAVLDMLGREVAVVQNGDLSAGEHVAPIRSERLPAGLYVIQLLANGTTATQRLTVVR